ncbi:uncharacterized protein L201_002022 [Kwoniella dendrophila CBS 6074]|uniref:RWD domain-containing protein n=1 Tax=Kwoniella dendrophila CBS 6074 TaxID=1295534 RepID=A0AAX4JP06_9TREE
MITSTSIPRSTSSQDNQHTDHSFHGDSATHLSSRSEARQNALSALEGLGKDLEGQRRSPPEQVRDPEGVLLKFIEHLTSTEYQDSDPHLTAIGYELEALLSIYGSSAVKLSLASSSSRPISTISTELPPSLPTSSSSSMEKKKSDSSQQYTNALWDFEIGFTPGERIRYEISLPVWEEGDDLDGLDKSKIPNQSPIMRVLVSLPPTYPNSSPPQLQLLGRYLGSFGIDSGLFGDITRTYISSNGVQFVAGDVCVFDGLTHVQSIVRKWYIGNLTSNQEGENAREAEKQQQRQDSNHDDHGHLIRGMSSLDMNNNGEENEYSYENDIPGSSSSSMSRPPTNRSMFSYSTNPQNATDEVDAVPDISKLKIYSSEPIIDRRSTFIGHSVRVTDEKEIPLLIHELLNDKKIAKAAHPAIFAYRLVKNVGGPAGKIYNTDYDDDGETAAGSRLKHLLEILELENVLVVVTRWFGGIQLGPDRFKHINQAARDALELGGFLNDKKSDEKDEKSGAKRRGGKK